MKRTLCEIAGALLLTGVTIAGCAAFQVPATYPSGGGAASHSYTLVEMKPDQEHRIMWCYYRDAQGHGYVEQRPMDGNICPYMISR